MPSIIAKADPAKLDELPISFNITFTIAQWKRIKEKLQSTSYGPEGEIVSMIRDVVTRLEASHQVLLDKNDTDRA